MGIGEELQDLRDRRVPARRQRRDCGGNRERSTRARANLRAEEREDLQPVAVQLNCKCRRGRFVYDNCSSVFCSDAASPTFEQGFERSIWRIRPHSTLPGPTSTKRSTPRAINSCMDCCHFTDPVTWRTRASRLDVASVTGAASTLQTT